MAYSDFTLDRAIRTFGLRLDEGQDPFVGVARVEVEPRLREALEEIAPLALAIHTEKARSEWIVAPVLVAVRRLMRRRISLFSGIEFHVVTDQGLNGVCDFLLGESTTPFFVEAPVLAVVEAKNDNIKAGLGQCVAEMVASRLFNERESRGPSRVFGLVTTGSLWRFLRLEGGSLAVNRDEYYLDELGTIRAALPHCVGGPVNREEVDS